MRRFERHGWSVTAAGLTLLYAVVSALAPRGHFLTAFADCSWFLAVLATAIIFARNSSLRPRQERWFWGLMALGFLMWSFNQVVWAYREVLLHGSMPDPYYADIILFLHVVPLIAAVASRPDQLRVETPVPLRALHFLMLLVWWIFIYGFLVFPYQYVNVNTEIYNFFYDRLYQIENLVLVAVLAFAAWTSRYGWRRLYLHLVGATGLYVFGAELLLRAVISRTYYSGSLFDVPLVGAICWMGAAAWKAPDWNLQSDPAPANWKAMKVAPQLAMFAILSMPLLALWTVLADSSPRPSKVFRLFSVLAAMLVLGAFAFMRQYLQDQVLVHLLTESRKTYETQLRLQSHLVQKEKLASLGNLVSGAAHEIKDPLSSILGSSEELRHGDPLNEQQDSLIRKIAVQAGRTSDLVSDLLSFARQTHEEKVSLDVVPILQRCAHMVEASKRDARLRVEFEFESSLPHIHANAQQLLQAFLEIIENSKEAVEEKGSGTLRIRAKSDNREVVVEFADNGPGIQDPHRVFDPFYTTKPIGKGTGLGLSVVYGIVQEHNGQIACHNGPTGGAVFVIKFPVFSEPAVHAAAASRLS